MIPVCALIKYTEKGPVRRIQVIVDGIVAYSYPGTRDQVKQLTYLLNDIWTRTRHEKLLHIDLDYDIEEPSLC